MNDTLRYIERVGKWRCRIASVRLKFEIAETLGPLAVLRSSYGAFAMMEDSRGPIMVRMQM